MVVFLIRAYTFFGIGQTDFARSADDNSNLYGNISRLQYQYQNNYLASIYLYQLEVERTLAAISAICRLRKFLRA